MKGKVHSIETFGAVDGPGIRCVVFLQGCPLRCIYCHNPDTWDTGCGKAKSMTVKDVVDEVRKYKTYFDISGGGVTLSGGEPLLQKEFVLEIFKECRKLGINTALDTSGYVSLEGESGRVVREVLEYTDLVLFDIKSTNEKTYEKITERKIDKSLAFIKALCEMKIPVVVRYVLIPEVTDSEQELLALKEMIAELKDSNGVSIVKEVEILPFHQLGKHKWEGKDYKLADVREATQVDVDRAKKILGLNSVSS